MIYNGKCCVKCVSVLLGIRIKTTAKLVFANDQNKFRIYFVRGCFCTLLQRSPKGASTDTTKLSRAPKASDPIVDQAFVRSPLRKNASIFLGER